MAIDKPFKTLFNGNDDRDKRLIKIFDKACKRFNIPNVLQDYIEHKIPASIPNMVLDTMNGMLTFRDAPDDEDFYKWGEKYDECFGGFFARDLIIRMCGFALVTKNLTYSLSEFTKKYTRKKDPVILEIGCGSGCLAKGLMDRDIKVIPTDSFSWYGSTFPMDRMWLPIKEIENIDMVDAVKKYAADVDFILCSWPTTTCPINDCMREMYKLNPKCKLLYCGEWYSGCTANDDFFDIVKECEGFIGGIDSVNRMHQTWDWIHDYWYLLEYDPASESVEGQSTDDFSDDLHNKLDNIAKEINGVKNSIVNITNDIIIDVCKIKQTIAQDE